MIGMKQKTLEMNKLKNTKWLRQKFFEKYDNLSENELNKRIECQKWYYEFCHKTSRGKKKKKKSQKKHRQIYKKSNNWMRDFRMLRIWCQIKNRKHICEWKIHEEHCVKIYEIDHCFYEHYENKNKSWWKWI